MRLGELPATGGEGEKERERERGERLREKS